MGIEGRLIIAIHTGNRRVDRVTIDSSRPVHASRVFQGKPVHEALQMVPMLFTVCATAQACAGVRACEQALGISAAENIENLRESLVQMETVREHLWRIVLDWPGLMGETPQKNGMTEILALQRDYREALTRGQDPFRLAEMERSFYPTTPSELEQRLDLILEHGVFAMSPNHWLEIDSPDALAEWAASGTTVAARLIADVMHKQWNGVGQCQVQALPSLASEQLNQLMQDDDFIERPQWSHECRETTCLTRVDSSLLKQLRENYGNGLLTRLVARLTELAQLACALMPGKTNLQRESAVTEDHTGIGHAQAARGQLLHRVQVEDEQISSYRILAPTEWNFHPRGVVASSLATLAGNVEQIEQQARLLINAIDPCVAYELGID